MSYTFEINPNCQESDLWRIAAWAAKHGKNCMSMPYHLWQDHREDMTSQIYLRILLLHRKGKERGLLFWNAKKEAFAYIKKLYRNPDTHVSDYYLESLVEQREADYSFPPEYRKALEEKLFCILLSMKKQKKGRALEAARRDAKILAMGLCGAYYSHISLMTGISRRNVKDYYSLAIRRILDYLELSVEIPEGYISTEEAQKVSGLLPHTISDYCNRGTVDGIRTRKGWFVSTESLEAYMASRY